MTIKRDLLKVDLKFLTEETHAKSGMYALEHLIYNVDGVTEWDSHRISQKSIDEEEEQQIFLVAIVYDDYENDGTEISSVISDKLFNEEGITYFKIECIKSEELSATITEEEKVKYACLQS